MVVLFVWSKGAWPLHKCKATINCAGPEPSEAQFWSRVVIPHQRSHRATLAIVLLYKFGQISMYHTHMVLLSNTGSPCTHARTNYVLTEWARQIAGFNGWVVLGWDPRAANRGFQRCLSRVVGMRW